jgi:hypothetical protein
MDNPVDHPIDLGFVNYVQHPTDDNYVVFRFTDEARALEFKIKLEQKKIWFEQGDGEMRTKKAFLFAVHKTDYKKAQTINYEVAAKHRKFIIPNTFMRYFVVIIGLGILSFAIAGYILNK